MTRGGGTVPTAFLDTNVLYGGLVSDVFLSLADTDRPLYEPKWSSYVKDELREHLTERFTQLGYGHPRMLTERKIHAIDTAFPKANIGEVVVGDDIRQAVRDPDDAPILAGAVFARADELVTLNVKDFHADIISRRWRIAISTPNAFLERLYAEDDEGFAAAMVKMVKAHRKTPRTLQELAETSQRHDGISALGGILEREMERQHAAMRTARPVSGPQGRDRLGRFTTKRGGASDLPNLLHGIWGPDGNGWA